MPIYINQWSKQKQIIIGIIAQKPVTRLQTTNLTNYYSPITLDLILPKCVFVRNKLRTSKN